MKDYMSSFFVIQTDVKILDLVMSFSFNHVEINVKLLPKT